MAQYLIIFTIPRIRTASLGGKVVGTAAFYHSTRSREKRNFT